MSDATEKNAQIVNAPIGGPSAAELRKPFEKTAGQFAGEVQQEHEQIVRNAGRK
jgi:hypothetical protein